ncbi:MAG: glycosyltransferase family 2 protein [Saprospiraceae bacterium]|nr:glycosyltransferase family 2 protein [Saprospiraceae bacterium]
MIQNWTIGIICFNERGTIAQVFQAVWQLLNDGKRKFEIILVDDASTDGSKEIIQDIAERHPQSVKTILHEKNQGIGEAIRAVYFNAKMENVVFVPGDGQFEVAELQPYLSFDNMKYICFYRRENQTYSGFRNALSYLNKLYNKLFLGLTLRDVNWVKAYKTEVIQNLDLKMHSSVIESEICAKLNYLKYTPVEVESKYLPRSYGQSKGASLQNIMRVFRELSKLTAILLHFKLSTRKSKMLL